MSVLSATCKKLVFILIFPNLVWASEELLRQKSLFEIGAGVFYANFPDYPGAGNNRTVILPFPTVAYRGEILRADKDEGVRGRFFKTDRLEVDLSFDGTFPSESADNPAREGMPDLDAVIEMGPKLIVRIKKATAKNKIEWDLHLATRYVFSSDVKKWSDRGFALNPFFTVKYEGLFKKEDVYIFGAGVKFASRKLMNYYYGVDAPFARGNRPIYHAKSGYMETSLSLGGFFPVKNDVWVFAGIIKPFYKGTANEASPLLVKRSTTSVALGINWNFYKSDIYVLE